MCSYVFVQDWNKAHPMFARTHRFLQFWLHHTSPDRQLMASCNAKRQSAAGDALALERILGKGLKLSRRKSNFCD